MIVKLANSYEVQSDVSLASLDVAVKPRNSVREFPEESIPQLLERFKSGVSLLSISKELGFSQKIIREKLTEFWAKQLEFRVLELGEVKISTADIAILKNTKARKILLSEPYPVSTQNNKNQSSVPVAYSELSYLYKTLLLSKEQEYYLFRRMNCLKYLAQKCLDTCRDKKFTPSTMLQLDKLCTECEDIQNQIILANQRLVVNYLKQKKLPNGYTMSEMISELNVVLYRAVRGFEYARGFKFSTYASWALIRGFSNFCRDYTKLGYRFITTGNTHEDIKMEEDHSDKLADIEVKQINLARLTKCLDKLDEREQVVIKMRYGISPWPKPLTLKEVGEHLGVTKERIRQIEARAFTKLQIHLASSASSAHY